MSLRSELHSELQVRHGYIDPVSKKKKKRIQQILSCLLRIEYLKSELTVVTNLGRPVNTILAVFLVSHNKIKSLLWRLGTLLAVIHSK